MSHTTEIVKYEKLSNGHFAVVVRCCGNASTDWSHTMAAQVASDPHKRSASINEARQKCADLHDHAIKAEHALIEEMGSQQKHE